MFLICHNSQIKLRRHKKIGKKKTKISPFINKYNWEGVIFLSEKDDWKVIGKKLRKTM